MTLEQYWIIVVKQWKIIVICIVFAGLGTYLVSKLLTPIYQSAALVQVAISSTSNQADYNSLLASDQLVQTETQLATSDPVLREVVTRYPGLTFEQLSKEATATTKLNTQLFEIDVQDASPARAAALANDIAATLIRQQLQATQQKNVLAQQQIQADLTNTRQQIDTIANEIAAISVQKNKGAQLAVLQAQLNGLQQHYSQWQAALAQLELTQAQNGNFLLIVQTAQPALHPVRPNVLLNTSAGLLAGFFLGILLAVLFVRLDTRVRTSEGLSQLLGWSVLSTVWRVRSSRGENIIDPKGHDANIEAYRILRSSIGFASIDKPLRTLLVTSPMPRNGKSVISANLAIYMAKAGKTTLLIDADLRRPTLHEKFNLPADKKGLSNAVLAFSIPAASGMPAQQSFTDVDASLKPFIHTVGIPNLLIMPTGPLPPNPSELLDSKAMQRFFTALKSSGIEVVIFDSPPLLGLSDASILASKVDGTLIVVDINHANKKNLKQVQALLTQAGAYVPGCVVNKQRRNRKDIAYSYYYRQVDEQNGEEGQGKKNGHALAVTTPPSMQSKTQSK